MATSTRHTGPPRSREFYIKVDRTLRSTALLSAIPALCLYAVDTARFDYTSTEATTDSSIVIDALAIVFLSLAVIRYLSLTISSLYQPPSHSEPWTTWVTVVVDLVFFMALLGLGDTTLAMRASPKNCYKYVNGCATWMLDVNRAAGALMIVTA